MASILVVCLSNAQGGMERVVLDDSQLLALDHEVQILCYRNSFIHKNSKVPSIPIKKMRNYFDFQALKFRDFDAIYLHQSGLIGPFRFFKRNQQKIIFHSHIFSERPKQSLYHRYLYSGVDQVLAISSEHVENLQKVLPKGTKIQWCPLGIEDPGSVGHGEKKEGHYVCFSRIDPNKGQDFLMELMKSMPQARMDLIGDPSPGQEEYARKLQESAPENVRFLGFMDQKKLFEVLPTYELACMPSRKETLGLVALECLARGIPTLVFEGAVSRDLSVGVTFLPKQLELWKKCLSQKSYQIPDKNDILKIYSREERQKHLREIF